MAIGSNDGRNADGQKGTKTTKYLMHWILFFISVVNMLPNLQVYQRALFVYISLELIAVRLIYEFPTNDKPNVNNYLKRILLFAAFVFSMNFCCSLLSRIVYHKLQKETVTKHNYHNNRVVCMLCAVSVFDVHVQKLKHIAKKYYLALRWY